MQQIKDVAKKYDRSIVAIAVTILSLLTFYFTVGEAIDKLLSRSPVIHEFKENKIVQDAFNVSLLKEISEVKSDINLILKEVRKNNKIYSNKIRVSHGQKYEESTE